jgi:hypothetical protein
LKAKKLAEKYGAEVSVTFHRLEEQVDTSKRNIGELQRDEVCSSAIIP